MQIPPSMLIGLAGVLLLGALVVGATTLLGLALLILNIWDRIRPRTDSFATVALVQQVETNSDRRFSENKQAIFENRTNSEHRFGEISGQLTGITSHINSLAEQFAELRGEMRAGRTEGKRAHATAA